MRAERILAGTLVCVALLAPKTALALVPVNGGMVGGTIITIHNGPGDQTEPRVDGRDGKLAVYTDNVSNSQSTLHYFDFATSSDNTVPSGSPGELDMLSD